jgi:hypothetical protein
MLRICNRIIKYSLNVFDTVCHIIDMCCLLSFEVNLIHLTLLELPLYLPSGDKYHKWPRIWTDFLDKQPKLKKMDMRFGTWSVSSTYRGRFI